jgi:nicotinate-nucleotide pyrophosphorylase (carboxylating)
VNIWQTPHTLALIDLAIEEDLGRGDVTSQATIAPDVLAVADFVCRQDLIVCGMAIAQTVFARVAPDVAFEPLATDGEQARRARRLARVTGPARSVLAAERTALNFIQRMSAVATLTSRFVAAAQGGGTKIVDTRKTTPGYRALEKYAVVCGGGSNHRFDLGSGILIKDNHIAAVGSVAKAVTFARSAAPHLLKVEVEVDTLEQFEEALAAGADVVLLDNFLTPRISEAVAIRNSRAPHVLLEVSGGITLERIPELSLLGVDLISVGALTHSALSVDIGLDFVE